VTAVNIFSSHCVCGLQSAANCRYSFLYANL
jgi:hypothetical protein